VQADSRHGASPLQGRRNAAGGAAHGGHEPQPAKMAWYVRKPKRSIACTWKDPEFCDQFIEFCDKASSTDDLKNQAIARMESCLYAKLMSLDAFPRTSSKPAARCSEPTPDPTDRPAIRGRFSFHH